MNKTKYRFFFCAFLLSLLVSGVTKGEIVGDIARSVWTRGVYLDKIRFDGDVLLSLTNDAQDLIATIGRTNQADTSIVMDVGEIKWSLPSDWFEVFAVHISPDQTVEGARVTRLKYVPADEWGKEFEDDISRASQYTIWGDTLIVEMASAVEDTLTIRYFALPTSAADTSGTVDLPARYIPMLKEIVVQACIERITFPSRSPRDEGLALTRLVQEALLNREVDGN